MVGENREAMKVSVVVPVYNKAPYLKECFDSIFSQSFRHFEVIAVDDRSTDDSLALLRGMADPRLRIIELDRNLGPAGCAQRGFDAATGEYIVRMDADDVMLPHRIDRQVAFMDENPMIGASGSHMELYHEAGVFRVAILNDRDCRSASLFHIPIYQPTSIYRRSTLLEHNVRFDDAWPRYGEDWFFQLRLLKVTQVANIDEALVRYRVGQQNISYGRDNYADLRTLFTEVLLWYGLPADDAHLKQHLHAIKFYPARLQPQEVAELKEYTRSCVRTCIARAFSIAMRSISGSIAYGTISLTSCLASAGAPCGATCAMTTDRPSTSAATCYPPCSRARCTARASGRNEPMKVSVIIPCLNVDAHVEATVRSALAQTHSDLEVIAVDDGSTDGTRIVLERLATEHRGRMMVIGQSNRGACAARNAGVSVSTGDWLQFLDADDRLLPGKVERQLVLAVDADVVVGSFRNVFDDGRAPTVVQPLTADPWESLVRTRMGTTSANLFRREAVLEAGGWDESLHSSQDYDLLFRLLKRGARIAWDEAVGCEVLKRRSGSISRTNEGGNWKRYLELRCAMRDHLRARDPQLHARVIAICDQYLFRGIRVLSKHDRQAAQGAFERMLPPGFVPERHTATSPLYILAFKLLGFHRAERLSALMRRTDPS
ncbi:MAG: glycosyltransferase [Flavobacteriales bacterium]|nr:glycosyltransferase [Flavobacteriales bacterium]